MTLVTGPRGHHAFSASIAPPCAVCPHMRQTIAGQVLVKVHGPSSGGGGSEQVMTLVPVPSTLTSCSSRLASTLAMPSSL